MAAEMMILRNLDNLYFLGTVWFIYLHTPVKSYVVKQPQEKWACDFHDDTPPLIFQLQVTEDFF